MSSKGLKRAHSSLKVKKAHWGGLTLKKANPDWCTKKNWCRNCVQTQGLIGANLFLIFQFEAPFGLIAEKQIVPVNHVTTSINCRSIFLSQSVFLDYSIGPIDPEHPWVLSLQEARQGRTVGYRGIIGMTLENSKGCK